MSHGLKIGDIVRGRHGSAVIYNGIGIIVGFDEDTDPIIWWFKANERWAEYTKDITKCERHERA